MFRSTATRVRTLSIIGGVIGITVFAAACQGDTQTATPLPADIEPKVAGTANGEITGGARVGAVTPSPITAEVTGPTPTSPTASVSPASTSAAGSVTAATPTATPPQVTDTPGRSSTPDDSGDSSESVSGGGPASPADPTPTSTAVFVPIPEEPNIPRPPDRDLQNLGWRLVEGYLEPKTVVASEPFVVGQKVDFWISRDRGSVIVSGEVVHISEHAYWIFENGFIPTAEDIKKVAENFESDVWPVVTRVFGTPLTPGIDGDDRIVVYHALLRTGVAGYFSAADSYPREILPFSNQREAVYMSVDRIGLTTPGYLSVIAHELQHASQFAADSGEESWVNEGLSEMAAELAGFNRTAVAAFVRLPSTSLTAWAQDISISRANYGAANLFFAFLATHYGGDDMLTAVSRNQNDGIVSIDSALAEQGFGVGANDVFADWLVANYLSAKNGPYSYENRSVPPVRNIYKRAPDSLSGTIRGYGADYVVTSTGSGRMTVEFQGQADTPLLIAPPHSGATCWWSNQGDSIDSTLTRTVDLRSVEAATLRFWTFYDIEEFWDYAYVMVSTNDGATWQILETAHSTSANPNGNSYGEGLTGQSGGWVQDSVDLSEYAGQKFLLRFEYITDDAVFSKGACFDDFEIPEIGWSDDTSSTGDWTANGFALVEETVPTQYLVQVIHEKDSGDPDVYQVLVDAHGTGKLTIEGIGEDDLIVSIISAVTRHSTSPTEYTLSISP